MISRETVSRKAGQKMAGFSMVEIMVAFLLGISLLSLLWTIFRSDQRRFFRDQNRLSGIQGALLLDEYLSADLERIVMFFPTASRLFNLENPAVLDGTSRSLTFIRVADRRNSEGMIETEKIRYFLDPATSRVFREVGGKTTAFRNLLAQDLEFRIRRFQPSLEAFGGAVGRRTYNRSADTLFIKYRLTCISERARITTRTLGAEELVTFVGAIPILYRSRRAHHGYWMMDPPELPATPGS